MKKLGIIYLIILSTLAAVLVHAADLSDADKQFLSGYEKVRSALAADNLESAKKMAGDLGGDGAELAKSSSLKEARAAFENLSNKAKTFAAGQSGYYVVRCPMLKKDWVQTNEKIDNPYYGKEMAACGEIKK